MVERVRMPGVPWPAPSFFRARPLLCAALALVAGIALAPHVPYGLWMWAAAGASLASGMLLRPFGRISAVALLLFFLLLGLARGATELQVPVLPETGRWTVEGTVASAVRQTEKAVIVTLRDVAVRPDGEDGFVPIDSNLYVYYPTEARTKLAYGQRVSVRGSAYLPSARRNPGGFDQTMWLAQSGSHVRLYASAAPQILGEAALSVRGAAMWVSGALGDRMDSVFGGASPVLRAMLVGDQDEVPDTWYGWLRDSGIVHLLSVSGLHVALWYLMLDRLLRPLPVSPRVRWALLALLLVAYSFLTGLQAPVLRAAIMLLIVQGGLVARRKVDPLTSLSVAALCMLLFRPLDVFAAGFQLSFCCVLGILLLGRPLSVLFRWLPGGMAGAASVTLAAQAGALPATAYWFGKISVVSLLTNLIAVPLSGLLTPVAALALALHALWEPLGWLFAHAARGMVAALLLLSRLGAGMPFATAQIGAFAWWTVAAFFFALLLCSTAVVWKWRARAVAAALAACLAVGAGALHGDFGVRYVQLDVGEALSGVLHSGRKTFVYDCGDEYSDLTEYLLYSGSRVEGLFLSHPHIDHVGGLTELLDAEIPVRTVYVPANADAFGAESGYRDRLDRARAQGADIVEVAAGDVLNLDGIRATIVAPKREATRGSDANDRSIVLLLEVGETLLLLCGDADAAAEPLGVDCDVLQVAHHGSRNAAGERFLADATPDIALISVGRNSYGHPHQETLARLAAAGAEIYATQESGALTLYLNGDRIRVEAYVK